MIQLKTIVFLAGMLCVCAMVRADMMPLPSSEVGVPSDTASTSCPCESPARDEAVNSDSLPAEAEQTGGMVPIKPQTDGRNGVTLWFCAVCGLGLARSSLFVRRNDVGYVVDSYCDDCPSQIGHRTVITPSDFGSKPAVCFIQSLCVVDDPPPQCCGKTFAPILRETQFIPFVRIPRGPPAMS